MNFRTKYDVLTDQYNKFYAWVLKNHGKIISVNVFKNRKERRAK